jgi:hypothetical protein
MRDKGDQKVKGAKIKFSCIDPEIGVTFLDSTSGLGLEPTSVLELDSLVGSRPGSVVGSPKGSRPGSVIGSPEGSKPRSVMGSPTGSPRKSVKGSRPGSVIGSPSGSVSGSDTELSQGIVMAFLIDRINDGWVAVRVESGLERGLGLDSQPESRSGLGSDHSTSEIRMVPVGNIRGHYRIPY